MAIVFESGISVGSGIDIGAGSGPGPSPGTNNVIGYSEMPPPVTAGGTLVYFGIKRLKAIRI